MKNDVKNDVNILKFCCCSQLLQDFIYSQQYYAVLSFVIAVGIIILWIDANTQNPSSATNECTAVGMRLFLTYRGDFSQSDTEIAMLAFSY